jgi:hypothetical protein
LEEKAKTVGPKSFENCVEMHFNERFKTFPLLAYFLGWNITIELKNSLLNKLQNYN